MEWMIIKTSNLLVRVAVDEIVYIKADGNYCDLVLINGQKRRFTSQLHVFENNINSLKNADMFIRVGRSIIVNKHYIRIIDLYDQTITFGYLQAKPEELGSIYTVKVSRDALKVLFERMLKEREHEQ